MTRNDDPGETSLSDETNAAIEKLCEEGQQLFDRGQFDMACTRYQQALELLPEPKGEWDTALWLYAALADARLQQKRYEEALQWAIEGKKAAGGLENPYIWLVAGQCDYELGNLRAAGNELITAYMLDGETIFEGQDPKYRAFLATVADLDDRPAKKPRRS